MDSVINVKCEIINDLEENFYKWPNKVLFKPEIGNKIVSLDFRKKGIIKNIVFCQSNEPYIELEVEIEDI